MALNEPEDADAIFKRMTEDLDLEIPNVTETVVSSLTDMELVEAYNRTKRELYARGEILKPTTDTGRDLQTQYMGYTIEMHKRGLQ